MRFLLTLAVLLTARPAFGQVVFLSEPSGKPTYEQLAARAIREGKPLIVWAGSGDTICPPCVERLRGEALHWMGDAYPGVGNALVVQVPENGQLWTVARITRWHTGDEFWGHVPSIRRALSAWRTNRTTSQGGWSMGVQAMPQYSGTMLGPPPMGPMMMPMMRRGGG